MMPFIFCHKLTVLAMASTVSLFDRQLSPVYQTKYFCKMILMKTQLNVYGVSEDDVHCL